MNKKTDLFELLPCAIESILYDADYMVSLEIEKDLYAVKLNAYEGTIVTFVDTNCSNNSHINIIHQILLKFKESAGFTLERVIIEAKYGDVFYCRLHWKHQNGDIYNVTSLGDALILAMLSDAPIFIVRFVVNQLEKAEREAYIEIYEDEDDDY